MVRHVNSSRRSFTVSTAAITILLRRPHLAASRENCPESDIPDDGIVKIRRH
jgi:hypothetical protein